MNNSFDCDVNVRFKLKVRGQRGEGCCVATDSAWICLLISFLFPIFQWWANFSEFCQTVRIYNSRVCGTPVVTKQTPHYYSHAWSSKWGGGKLKPVICVRLHARALDSPGRRKGSLQQHVAMMMRSPDRGSKRSLRLPIMWNFVWTLAWMCRRNWQSLHACVQELFCFIPSIFFK